MRATPFTRRRSRGRTSRWGENTRSLKLCDAAARASMGGAGAVDASSKGRASPPALRMASAAKLSRVAAPAATRRWLGGCQSTSPRNWHPFNLTARSSASTDAPRVGDVGARHLAACRKSARSVTHGDEVNVATDTRLWTKSSKSQSTINHNIIPTATNPLIGSKVIVTLPTSHTYNACGNGQRLYFLAPFFPSYTTLIPY